MEKVKERGDWPKPSDPTNPGVPVVSLFFGETRRGLWLPAATIGTQR